MKFMSLILILLLLNGCTTLQIDDTFNGKTKEEVTYMRGVPDKTYTDSPRLKYNVDEVWFYRNRYGSTSLFYFKNDRVIGEDKGLHHKSSHIKTNGMTKEEIRNMLGSPSYVSEEPLKLKYNADEVWVYNPYCDDTYIYFRNGIVVREERKWWEAL